jgi:uncharacterized membrane protein
MRARSDVGQYSHFKWFVRGDITYIAMYLSFETVVLLRFYPAFRLHVYDEASSIVVHPGGPNSLDVLSRLYHMAFGITYLGIGLTIIGQSLALFRWFGPLASRRNGQEETTYQTCENAIIHSLPSSFA